MLVFLIMSVGGVIVCVMVAAVAFSCNWSWYHGACSALRKRMRHQTIRFSLLRLFIRLVGENGIDLGFRVDEDLCGLHAVLVYRATDGRDVLIDVPYPVYLRAKWALGRAMKRSSLACDYILSDVQAKIEDHIDRSQTAIESAVHIQREAAQRLLNEASPFEKDYIRSQIDILL